MLPKKVLIKYIWQITEVKLRSLSNVAKNICGNFRSTVLPGCILELRKLNLLGMRRHKKQSGGQSLYVLKKRSLLHTEQLGHLSAAKGDFKQASIWYRKALSPNPKDATHCIFLGSNAFQRGLLKQSEAYYRRALKCSEGCLEEAYFNLGGILLGKRNYSEAIKCYQEALKIDPKYGIPKKRLDDAKLAHLMLNS